MDHERTHQQLSEALSNAALDPAAWPAFLENLANTFDANSVTLHWQSPGVSPRANVAFKYGLAATVTSEFEGYYGPRSPIITRAHAGKLIVPGRTVLGQEACPEKTFLSSEFYTDFLKPIDMRHVLGGTIVCEGPEMCLISVCGSHGRKAFGVEESRLLEAVIPQMRTALVLQRKLMAAERRLLRIKTAFDLLPDAVVLVAANAVVLAANEAARKVFARRDGLFIDGDRLRIVNRSQQSNLLQSLKRIALARQFDFPAPPGTALRVLRPSGQEWLLQVFPTVKGMTGIAAIFINSAAMDTAPADSDLEQLFGLSPMQRQVALRLFDHLAPNEIGDHLGITRNTIKTHIRRVFSKLGISRHVELVRLFAKLKPRK